MQKFLLTILVFAIPFVINAQTVYKTPSGEKYHTANCRMVKNVSQAIPLKTVAQYGLDPCKICKPAVLAKTNSLSLIKKPAGEDATKQCKGKTKKGTRCKHMTSIGNGYCFQHQPG